MTGYTSPKDVRDGTGVQPADFLLPDDDALDALLDRWAEQVKGLIDQHCNRDFLTEAGGDLDQVPQPVRSVAERAMMRLVGMARANRDSALVRIDEFRVTTDLVDEVLPASLRRDLPRAAPRFAGFVSHA